MHLLHNSMCTEDSLVHMKQEEGDKMDCVCVGDPVGNKVLSPLNCVALLFMRR